MRLVLLSLASACSVFAADINLVAKITTTLEEGAAIKRVQFLSADGAFAVSLDSETEIERLADGTRFTFQALPSATCDIRPSPVPKTQPITQENHKAYLDAARAFAPGNAIVPERPEVTEHPLAINNWKSHRVEFEYHLVADPKRMLHRIAVTFITLENGQQIALVTNARASEFVAAHARAESLIRSWFPVRDITAAN